MRDFEYSQRAVQSIRNMEAQRQNQLLSAWAQHSSKWAYRREKKHIIQWFLVSSSSILDGNQLCAPVINSVSQLRCCNDASRDLWMNDLLSGAKRM